jgi:hypothetical protein
MELIPNLLWKLEPVILKPEQAFDLPPAASFGEWLPSRHIYDDILFGMYPVGRIGIRKHQTVS